MKMPEMIDDIMLAPCGMNCTVCYKHVGILKNAKPCEGCLKGDLGKPERCRLCKIKSCAQEKGFVHCFECESFPCIMIKSMEASYKKRYNTSLIENSLGAKDIGLSKFLSQDRIKWTCAKCGGAFSLHDGVCSECGCNRTYTPDQ